MPDTINIANPEIALKLWAWMEAIDWKWPPSVLLEQDEMLMEDIINIQHYITDIEKQLREQNERTTN